MRRGLTVGSSNTHRSSESKRLHAGQEMVSPVFTLLGVNPCSVGTTPSRAESPQLPGIKGLERFTLTQRFVAARGLRKGA